MEANNKVRELEAAERREIIRILTVFSDELRPHVQEVLDSYRFLAEIDLVHAKAEMAEQIGGFEPEVKGEPTMDWIRAIHPLLQRSLAKQDKKVVPLDIRLETTDATDLTDKKKNIGRLLIISGPNAGGKSVCLMRTIDTHWRPFDGGLVREHHDRHRRRAVDSRRPVHLFFAPAEHEEHDEAG